MSGAGGGFFGFLCFISPVWYSERNLLASGSPIARLCSGVHSVSWASSLTPQGPFASSISTIWRLAKLAAVCRGVGLSESISFR